MNLKLLQEAFKHVIPEQFCASNPRARAHFRKYLRFLTFSILAFFKYKVACDTKLQVNWDEEFISLGSK